MFFLWNFSDTRIFWIVPYFMHIIMVFDSYFCEGNLFLFLTSSNLSLYLILFIIWIWIGFFRTILFLFSSISSSIFVMDKVYSYIIESINHDLDYSSRLKKQYWTVFNTEYGWIRYWRLGSTGFNRLSQ